MVPGIFGAICSLVWAALDAFYQNSSNLAFIAGGWLLVEGSDSTTLQIAANGQVQGGNDLGADAGHQIRPRKQRVIVVSGKKKSPANGQLPKTP